MSRVAEAVWVTETNTLRLLGHWATGQGRLRSSGRAAQCPFPSPQQLRGDDGFAGSFRCDCSPNPLVRAIKMQAILRLPEGKKEPGGGMGGCESIRRVPPDPPCPACGAGSSVRVWPPQHRQCRPHAVCAESGLPAALPGKNKHPVVRAPCASTPVSSPARAPCASPPCESAASLHGLCARNS